MLIIATFQKLKAPIASGRAMYARAVVSPRVALHRQETARGILLLFVFYLHALFALVEHVGGPQAAPLAWSQNRLISAQVALFFILAGQTATTIERRPFRSILSRSLALLILAAISHTPAVLLLHVWDYEQLTGGQVLRDLRFLLMHGWVLVTIYPFAAQFLPRNEHWATYIGLALLLPPTHWCLFMLLRRPLSACHKLANRLSQKILHVGAHRYRPSEQRELSTG